MYLEISRQISEKNTECQVGAKLFHADGRADRPNEANIRLSQFCERA